MPHRRRPSLGFVALTALAASAFAPTLGSASTGTLTTTVGGVEVRIELDDDPASEQPVMLLLGAAAQEQHQQAHDATFEPARDHATAYVELGCGDLGGPQDRANLAAIGAWLGGTGGDDLGAMLDGVTGRVAARGDGVAGFQLLSTTTSPEGRDAFVALVTDGAIVDPYTILFSEDGVLRRTDSARPTPVARDNVQRLDQPTLPCPHGGAVDGTRDAYWADRDVRPRLADRTAAWFLNHAVDAPLPIEQSFMAAPLFGNDPLEVYDTRLDHADGVDPDMEALFVTAHLYDDPSGDTARAKLSLHPFKYWQRMTTANFGPCAYGVCYGYFLGFAGGGDRPEPSGEPFFLNRTFEQDLDCTPDCVPGPGTGEVGTLESVNRFTSPHAPVFTWVDAGVNSERVTAPDLLNEGEGLLGVEELPGGHGYHSLAFTIPPVEDELWIIGQPRLEAWFNTSTAGGTVTPLLVELRPDPLEPTANGEPILPIAPSFRGNDRMTVISRGAIDLDFHAGTDARRHEAGWKRAVITFDPVAAYLDEGSQLMLVLQSSNVDQFHPGTPQGTVNVATGPVDGVTETGSILYLPIVDR